MSDDELSQELQEIAELLRESEQGAPPLELDKTWWLINAPLWEAEMLDDDDHTPPPEAG